MEIRMPHVPVAAARENYLQRFAALRRGVVPVVGGLPPRLGTSPRSDAASPGSGPCQRGKAFPPSSRSARGAALPSRNVQIFNWGGDRRLKSPRSRF
ncbi:hypothetical protein NDU88_005908 [Pleurodeles waltl]|uniref:Uncharacterized protein n=1 Tax=Pleurodeles waltl TaxID=8319 RepID=A0AAV7QH46_PLEWA|nr:hypothetical protein NDU88_005908 [Pleurodeles waltl]